MSFTTFVSLQLRKPRGLSQPVVLIRGHDAELLMGVVNKNREAHVKIEVKEPPAWVRHTVPTVPVSFLPWAFPKLLIFLPLRCRWYSFAGALQSHSPYLHCSDDVLQRNTQKLFELIYSFFCLNIMSELRRFLFV